MLKLGKLTDYATVLMAAIAAEPARVHTAVALAGRTRIAAPTVAKLLKLLARKGLLGSQRGTGGGYRLLLAPSAVTVADVVRALEGPIAVTACSAHDDDCALARGCATREPFRLINVAIRNALEAVTLADIARGLPAANAAVVASAAREVPLTFTPARATEPGRHEPPSP